MWINDHPYIFFYLMGCVVVVLLMLSKGVIFWFICWTTKTNVLNRNLRKVLPPDDSPLLEKVAGYAIVFLFDLALSWVGVAIALWQIIYGLFRTARDMFSAVPEEVKRLRFPLKNNPNMSRENVWAYLTALNVKAGEGQPGAVTLVTSLRELSGYYPGFDCVAALKQLNRLNVVDLDVMAATMGKLERSGDD